MTLSSKIVTGSKRRSMKPLHSWTFLSRLVKRNILHVKLLLPASSSSSLSSFKQKPSTDENITVAVRDQYAKTGEGFFILYSITSRASFEAIPGYVRSILRAKDCDLSECPPIIILGNKTDMNDARQVSMDEGKAMADQLLTYRWRHHPRFSSPSSARAKLEEEEEREDKKNNNKKKKKKRKSKKKRGFVFRHNFFETSVKNDTVTFYGAPDKPVESHHGALIVDELVRQVDEWRLNQVMGKEGVVERDKNKHNNDSNGKCLLM
ncbi:RAS1 protein, variant 2 [Balamuthia mandrillaris]